MRPSVIVKVYYGRFIFTYKKPLPYLKIIEKPSFNDKAFCLILKSPVKDSGAIRILNVLIFGFSIIIKKTIGLKWSFVCFVIGQLLPEVGFGTILS